MSFAALQQSGLELGLCRKRGRGWPNNLGFSLDAYAAFVHAAAG